MTPWIIISLILYVKIDKREERKKKARKMRLLAAVCVFVIAINYLGSIRGVDGINVNFSLDGVTSVIYSNFIDVLRGNLPNGPQQSHGVPVLNQSLPNSIRFILVDLSTYDNGTITVAIDRLNVYVVGYRAGNSFYYLNESNVPFKQLFTDIKDKDRILLPFSGSYPDLENSAGKREQFPLGGSSLNSAINRLLFNDKKPGAIAQSLLVIIQMVSEAARFGFIERQVSVKIQGEETYKPGPATLSLQNNWSALSEQIQWAYANGTFKNPVQLVNATNHPFFVKDVKVAKAAGGIAIKLLLYRPPAAASLQLPSPSTLISTM